jgi:hypothetical protein
LWASGAAGFISASAQVGITVVVLDTHDLQHDD